MTETQIIMRKYFWLAIVVVGLAGIWLPIIIALLNEKNKNRVKTFVK